MLTALAPTLPLTLGAGRGTSSAPVGNLINVTTWAQALTLVNSTGVSGDVVNMNHAGYTDDTPRTMNVTRGLNTADGSGLNVIFRATQPVQLVIQNVDNVCMEFSNFYFSGDAVIPGFLSTSHSVYIVDSSKICIQGGNAGQGEANVFIYSPTGKANDIRINNVNAIFPRTDHFKFAGALDDSFAPTRLEVTNNNKRDGLFYNHFWFKADGTTPIINSAFQSGYLSLDVAHIDGIQTYFGHISHMTYTGNIINSVGNQGVWMTYWQQDVLIQGNTVVSALPNNMISDHATRVAFIGNTCSQSSDPDPNTAGTLNFMLVPDGSGAIKAGLNVITNPGAVNIDVGGTGLSLTGPVATVGTAFSDPSLPTWRGTNSNVGNLNTLRQRPSYTPYAGLMETVVNPIIVTDYVPGSLVTTSPTGTYFKAVPLHAKGFTYANTSNYETQWKLNGSIVQGPTVGLAGMVYQANTAGTVTVEMRAAPSGTGNGSFLPGQNTVTVTSTTNSFATGGLNVVYTNSNKTITKAVTNGVEVRVQSANAGRSYTGTANYWFSFVPTKVGDTYWGITDGTRSVFCNGVSLFYENGLGGFSNVASASPFVVMNGTDTVTCILMLTPTTAKLYMYSATNGWLAACGNPNAGGAGYNLYTLAPLLAGTLKINSILLSIGDQLAGNFGPTPPGGGGATEPPAVITALGAIPF